MWKQKVSKWQLPTPGDFGGFDVVDPTPIPTPPPNVLPNPLPEIGGEVPKKTPKISQEEVKPNDTKPVVHKPDTDVEMDSVGPMTTGDGDKSKLPKNDATVNQTGAAVGAGAFNIPSLEVNAQPESGMPITETRTVRHRWEGYFSINNIQPYAKSGAIENTWSSVNNHPYNPLILECVEQPSTGPLAFGPSVDMAPHRGNNSTSGGTNYNARFKFPRTLICTDAQSLSKGLTSYNVCTWVNWYRKMYKFYAPLGARHTYTISTNYFTKSFAVLDNASWDKKNNEIYIGHYVEDYVDTNIDDIRPYQLKFGQSPAASGTAAIKNLTKQDFDKFKGITWYKLDYQTPSITIKTKWKPGEDVGSVRNLNDMKQWYNVGAPPSPTWACLESFIVVTGDYNTCEVGPCVNVHVQSEYDIQYKGLVPVLKYQAEPTPQNDAVHLRPGIDNIQFPFSRAANYPTTVAERATLDGTFGWQPAYSYT